MTRSRRALLGLAVALGCLVAEARGAEPARPNVLLIMVDDLRPAPGCYGDPLGRTPNIDRLAAGARAFLAAYCQQAMCGPSRASLLSGLRPDSTRVWHNRHVLRERVPGVVTLPGLFKEAGYHTEGLGSACRW